MSENQRRAEQRAVRKAVGQDAAKMLQWMATVIDDELKPTIALMAQTITDLSAKVETLEKRQIQLAPDAFDRVMKGLGLPTVAEGIGYKRAEMVDGDLSIERVGAEVV